MDKKVDLKNYQCVFNEKGFFGGDQCLPEKDPLKYTDILKKHGIHAKLNPIIVGVQDIKKRMEKGPIIVSVRPTILYDIKGNITNETEGGHTMSVVGVSENGLVRVSSWGREYYVKSGTYAKYEYYQQVIFRDTLETV